MCIQRFTPTLKRQIHSTRRMLIVWNPIAIEHGEKLKRWDLDLPQAEFAYNTLPKLNKAEENLAKKVQQVHSEVRANLEVANAQYKEAIDQHRRKKEFKEGDLVMAYLYDWNISNTFNVSNLSEYHKDIPIYPANSGTSSFPSWSEQNSSPWTNNNVNRASDRSCRCRKSSQKSYDQSVAAAEQSLYETYAIKEDEKVLEPEIVEGIENHGDFFVGMVQRARVAETVKSNEEDNIGGLDVFKTTATVNVVMVKVVIDTSNSENLVSKELVKKLKLPTQKHLQPYSLRWIRKMDEEIDMVTETDKQSCRALSRKTTLLVTIAVEVTSFEFLREHYTEDTDFQQMWNLCCEHQDAGDFLIHNVYLFKSDNYVHSEVRANLEVANAQYKEAIDQHRHKKEVTWKSNDNAYVLQLPDDWNISNTFNVSNLFEYHEDIPIYLANSGMSSFPSGRD
ncbi:hypothetical protein JRO89_XS13G0121100 [Xanthoceras sorbifolium]|uniref:Uncharacterized protein n=1 Tax=Xanthoceras sorbifolium TaxID=99658 RepID=A0ABQ8H807_9ROSI|nr:hypothetical protein JRO89_XS13G0121100 [Xanthoceras sorbifolium]